jgi:hypothetical protein
MEDVISAHKVAFNVNVKTLVQFVLLIKYL